MGAYIRDLQTAVGDTIYPTTKTEAVWNESGQNLNMLLQNAGSKIVVSPTQPTYQNIGDTWYRIV